jgi:uncharacterized membrane protein HdeD (DUF308 family)
MKAVKAKDIRRHARKVSLKIEALPFTSLNYQIFAAGLVLIILGYVALAQPPVDSFMSLTVAPILLILGYCVVIPFAIMYQKKESAASPDGKDKTRS